MKKRRFRKSLSEKKNTQNDLLKKITEISEGLYYISETDAEILPFSGNIAENVSKEEILKQTKSANDINVEERDFDEVFERLTRISDWFGDREKEIAERYAALRDLLKNNLKDLRIYKLGRIQIDIYFVGLDSENRLVGIQTKAIET